MAWELKFQAEKGQRLHRYFWQATIMDKLEPDLWWCDEYNMFLPHEVLRDSPYGYSSHSRPIRTLRAFKRFLRKHHEIRGRTVRLVSRYVGYDIEAEWRG